MAISSMKRWAIRSSLLGLLLVPTSIAFADAPTTAPTTAPVEFAADAPARTWFSQLDSPDPKEREAAREGLMALPSEQLPMLRLLVATTRSLSAAQAVSLHDIVIQVFLSGEKYPSEPGGFLGLRWPADFALGMDTLPRFGVPIEIRLPGFPGFGVLRTGDMIIGVLVEPDLPLNRLPNLRTPTHTELTEAVSPAGAGRRIALEVLRYGEVIRVSVKLAPHPITDFANLEAMFADRETRAEKYWQTEFLPLLTMS